eukprot:SAG22_NODE_286_length_12969_cov_6.982828_3_plen_866_part_00
MCPSPHPNRFPHRADIAVCSAVLVWHDQHTNRPIEDELQEWLGVAEAATAAQLAQFIAKIEQQATAGFDSQQQQLTAVAAELASQLEVAERNQKESLGKGLAGVKAATQAELKGHSKRLERAEVELRRTVEDQLRLCRQDLATACDVARQDAEGAHEKLVVLCDQAVGTANAAVADAKQKAEAIESTVERCSGLATEHCSQTRRMLEQSLAAQVNSVDATTKDLLQKQRYLSEQMEDRGAALERRLSQLASAVQAEAADAELARASEMRQSAAKAEQQAELRARSLSAELHAVFEAVATKAAQAAGAAEARAAGLSQLASAVQAEAADAELARASEMRQSAAKAEQQAELRARSLSAELHAAVEAVATKAAQAAGAAEEKAAGTAREYQALLREAVAASTERGRVVLAEAQREGRQAMAEAVAKTASDIQSEFAADLTSAKATAGQELQAAYRTHLAESDEASADQWTQLQRQLASAMAASRKDVEEQVELVREAGQKMEDYCGRAIDGQRHGLQELRGELGVLAADVARIGASAEEEPVQAAAATSHELAEVRWEVAVLAETLAGVAAVAAQPEVELIEARLQQFEAVAAAAARAPTMRDLEAVEVRLQALQTTVFGLTAGDRLAAVEERISAVLSGFKSQNKSLQVLRLEKEAAQRQMEPPTAAASSSDDETYQASSQLEAAGTAKKDKKDKKQLKAAKAKKPKESASAASQNRKTKRLAAAANVANAGKDASGQQRRIANPMLALRAAAPASAPAPVALSTAAMAPGQHEQQTQPVALERQEPQPRQQRGSKEVHLEAEEPAEQLRPLSAPTPAAVLPPSTAAASGAALRLAKAKVGRDAWAKMSPAEKRAAIGVDDDGADE